MKTYKIQHRSAHHDCGWTNSSIEGEEPTFDSIEAAITKLNERLYLSFGLSSNPRAYEFRLKVVEESSIPINLVCDRIRAVVEE